MDKETQKKRIGAIRGLLKKNRINCLVLTGRANVSYVTGFLGDDSWALITSRGLYLLTDSRYIEQARKECRFCRIIQRTGAMAPAAARLVQKLKSVQAVHVESSTTMADFKALKKHVRASLKTADGVIEAGRSIKDNSEIAAVRTAARIAGQALQRTLKRVKPGMTENQLAGALDFEVRQLGACNCFETIVAFGPNASRPHHQPGGRKLRKNDSILIDFGVRYRHYCCDITRCFAVGRPSALYKKVYETVRQAQAAAIKMVKAGVKIQQVDKAARDVVSKSQLPVYGHGTGHGLGLEVHEGPVVSKEGKGKLRAGMVFTIEPGVYIPGKLGVRIEDDVLVTEAAGRILSRESAKEVAFSTLSL
ncbi:MAG: M24 family metallopeptidase [Planctomycetota bacterium]|jgi:Xaa-Pro aminopeptidase